MTTTAAPSPSTAKAPDPKIEEIRRKDPGGGNYSGEGRAGGMDEKKFRALLNQALTRADDRALSGLQEI